MTVPIDAAAPPPTRASALESLRGGTVDLLVIGGGATGCGLARDAALRGLRVALVEREDVASGTSSRSSRLVHGGVRYLEQGALGLVFEASAERRRLLRLAPHLVRPLEFTWPVYEGARVPTWKLAAGLTLYDLLALFRNVGRHRRLDASDVLAREPRLRGDGLRGGASYWDAATDDARLTLATAMDASRAGAVVLTHASVTALVRDTERVVGARVHDLIGGESFDVRARVVVNATGPWSDQVRSLDPAEGGTRATVRGSKGAHIAVPRERVGNTGALTLIVPSDGRVFFVLPSGPMTIIDTTDTDSAAAPEAVRASRADVDYLLAAANAYFTEARLVSADVVSAWAGVRPRAAQAGIRGSAPSGASREHAIVSGPGGMISVTGGKLTTYRAMAAELADAVERALGHAPTRSPTSDRPLPGGQLDDPEVAVRAATSITGDASVARRLVQAYGSEWSQLWRTCMADDVGRSRLDPGLPYLAGELRWGVSHELALTLGDLLIRRVPVAFERRDHAVALAARAAEIVAPLLGWDDERATIEIERYRAEAERMFGIEE